MKIIKFNKKDIEIQATIILRNLLKTRNGQYITLKFSDTQIVFKRVG